MRRVWERRSGDARDVAALPALPSRGSGRGAGTACAQRAIRVSETSRCVRRRRGARGNSRGRARMRAAARPRGKAAAVAARRQAHGPAERSRATQIRNPPWCALCCGGARHPSGGRARSGGGGGRREKTTHGHHGAPRQRTSRDPPPRRARERGATLSTGPVCVGSALREALAKREPTRCRAGATARSDHDALTMVDRCRRCFRPCAPARRAPRPGHAPPHAPLVLASLRRARRSRKRPCHALARGELVRCTLAGMFAPCVRTVSRPLPSC
jgi:hypothetical protein